MNAVSLRHWAAASLSHGIFASRGHCVMGSLRHGFIASRGHRVTGSLRHGVIALPLGHYILMFRRPPFTLILLLFWSPLLPLISHLLFSFA